MVLRDYNQKQPMELIPSRAGVATSVQASLVAILRRCRIKTPKKVSMHDSYWSYCCLTCWNCTLAGMSSQACKQYSCLMLLGLGISYCTRMLLNCVDQKATISTLCCLAEVYDDEDDGIKTSNLMSSTRRTSIKLCGALLASQCAVQRTDEEALLGKVGSLWG